nr:DUF4166 domain-containing protein [Marinibactrum halimedae]
MAPVVQQAHHGSTRLEGEASVHRGNRLAQWICHLFGMPPEAKACRLIVTGHHDANIMLWNRYFDDYPMNSYFYKCGDYIIERLGPIHLLMKLDVNEGALTYSLEKTRILGIPIPRWMAPRVYAVEQQVNDKYRFSVDVSIPLVGHLVGYLGDLSVETLASPS